MTASQVIAAIFGDVVTDAKSGEVLSIGRPTVSHHLAD
jgi:hypothetical protein